MMALQVSIWREFSSRRCLKPVYYQTLGWVLSCPHRTGCSICFVWISAGAENGNALKDGELKKYLEGIPATPVFKGLRDQKVTSTSMSFRNDKPVVALIQAMDQKVSQVKHTTITGLSRFAWSIVACKLARSVDRVILSTDSEEIAEVAKRYGCEVPFMRPAELASDLATDKVYLSIF